MNLTRLRELLEQVIFELYALGIDGAPPDPPPTSGAISRVRFRVLRAQYNRRLFPEQYTQANPMGLYNGKALAAALAPGGHFNRESNVWLDLTAYGPDGAELQREHLKRLGLAYRTAFTIGDGRIVGNGANDQGLPADWIRDNPSGANISEETWRTSLGFTVRVHFSDEGEWRCSGSVSGQEGESIVIRTS